jgi:D-glycero-alpha-D-manno-heptose-7-phosphate kinase
MIISRTPYRISFFGGGTDYPGWYRINSGQVLSGTIDKYLFITCRHLPPFFKHRLRLVYSKIENCQSVNELRHPTARETLKFLKVNSGLEIHYDGDLPGRSGMGSSSAFTVGLLNALYAYRGENISEKNLAVESIHIEQNLVGENVGSQDQVNAAYGGLNKIKFFKDGEIDVEPVRINDDVIRHLDRHLMLFYTGIQRTAATIAATYTKNILAKEKQLKRLHAMVDESESILKEGNNLDEFGSLLHEAWMEKRSLSAKVSTHRVDTLYEAAREAGALGGKLSGAGGGGMLLLFVPLDKQEKVKERLSNIVHIPFQFEFEGSQIVFVDKRTSRAY